MASNDVRGIAAQTIAKVFEGQSLNSALPWGLDKVEASERSLLQQLCYGSLREAPKLLGLLEPLLDKPLRRKDADVEALLLIGIYQLLSMRIPDHAAVAQTVDAIKHLKKPWARSLTNAVLRSFLREQEALLDSLDEATAASHPAWLFGKIRKQWPLHWQAIVSANNAQPPMTLRVNAARVSRAGYLETLAAAGIDAAAGTLSAQAITLRQPLDVEALPGFAQGDVSVQDEAAQVAAHFLNAQAGERILDACAAPGGKTCHVLELQPGLEVLVAEDISAERLEKVSENLSRLGLSATLAAADAGEAPQTSQTAPQAPQTESPALFDRILVDAPCSASGVIRRHPDVKILRQPEDLQSFAAQQLRILLGVWPRLKKGGTLLYATCSILKEENQQVVDAFREQTPDASIDPITTGFGEAINGALQLIPHAQGSDGLFYCRLIRN
ncbi:MAG: 16S rRNA (cytosine(967)-C(5))-methyltransferase RsmB [Halioglobus sp.]